MRVISDENMKNMVEALDEKYAIAIGFDNQADKVSYNTMLNTLECFGFDWERDENGKHKIFGNYPN